MSSSNVSLSTGLALALGITLTLAVQSTEAVGYPAGASVSLGSNPIESGGGTISNGTTGTVFTPAGAHDFILTDLVLTGRSNDGDCRASIQFDLILGSGQEVGDFNLGINNRNEHPGVPLLVNTHFSSGIRIPSGDTLTATVTSNTEYACSAGTGRQVSYAFSGYYAQS